MITCAVIVVMAKSTLDRIGSRTVGQQKERLKARVFLKPLLDDCRSVNGRDASQAIKLAVDPHAGTIL